MTRRTILLLFVAACTRGRCTDDRSPTVKPQPESRDSSPVTLTLDDYVATIYGPGPNASFHPTTGVETAALARLIPALLDAAWSPRPTLPAAWQDEARAAGFRIDVWLIGGERYWALRELEGHARGAGAYIFRVAPRDKTEPTILLEAPHNYYDVGTGRLAAELFVTPRKGPRPRALFTNTIHRYQLAPGDKKKRKVNPADVAHNPEHGFAAATEAFAIAAGELRVIQLHGFGARVDEDDDGGDVGAIAMVVSAGDAQGSSPLSAAIAAAAKRVFGDVERFPEDTKVLGATTNVQGRLLRRLGRGDFVHVEMSADLRKQLAASPELRTQLANVLFEPQEPR